MQQDVIVLGYNYSTTLGAARSLGEAGYGVRLLVMTNITQRIAGHSKYVKSCVMVRIDFDEIYRGLETLRGGDARILVIPLHDMAGLMLDEHLDLLREHYILPNIRETAGEVAALMDKMRQKLLAQRCGLRTAEGVVLPTDAPAPDGLRYPCFVKPLASGRCKSVKQVFSNCGNREDMEAALAVARDKECAQVLAEELLDVEAELSAYGFAMNGQVFMPARMDMLRGGFGRHRGIAAEGLITSSSTFGEMRKHLEDFVRESGYSGLFCIDLLKSGGEYYFSEINFRCGGSGYAVTLAGANLFGAYADMVYRRTDTGPTEIRQDVRFLSEMMDLDAFLDGFIDWKTFRAHISGPSARFMRNKADPVPWVLFRLMGIKRWLRQKLRR